MLCRPITVAPYTGAPLQKISEEKVEHETKVSGDQIKHQEHSVPEQQRVPSSTAPRVRDIPFEN